MKKETRSEFLTLSIVLALGVAGCLLLYVLRFAIAGSTAYRYLVWNLVLASVPYVIAAFGAHILARYEGGRRGAVIAIPIALLWLVFYPNAPYIFTDFIYVINRSYYRFLPSDGTSLNTLLWYDLLMNAVFAFIAHFIGLISMWLMQKGIARAWGVKAARVLVGVAMLLAGLGIYLGRFSRLNSWDIVLDTRKVFTEVAEASADRRAMLFSAAFSLFIFLTYTALVVFKRINMPLGRARKD